MVRLSINRKCGFFRRQVEGISSIPACCLATHLIGNLGATGGDGAGFLALIQLIVGKDSW
jgi:hypothetical protein